MFRLKPEAELFKKLIILDVQDANEARSRADYAQLIEKAAGAGAKVIGIDALFSKEKDRLSDSVLVKVANQYADRLVIAYRFGENLSSPNESALHQKNLTKVLPDNLEGWKEFYQENGVELPFIPLLTDTSRFGLGHVIYYHDYDNVIRHFPLVVKYKQGFYSSLSLEMVKRYGNAKYAIDKAGHNLLLHQESSKTLVIPFDKYGQVLIDLIPQSEFTIYRGKELEANFGENFYGAMVLIVNSFGMEESKVPTPFLEPYPKWGFHASLISQILAQNFTRDEPVDTVWASGIFMFLGMIWLVVKEYRLSPKKRKPWMSLLALNVLIFIFTFLMLCLGLRLLVFLSALAISTTFVLMRKRFYELIQPAQYLDLGIAVLERQGEKYPLLVFESPIGNEETNAFCETFFEQDAFQRILQRLSRLDVNREDLRTIGDKLFNAIFQTELYYILERSLDKAQIDNKNLRIKLRLDAPELLYLPWELMHTSKRVPSFIVLDKSLSLVRYPPLIKPFGKPDFKLPLKILVLISSPTNLAKLDVEQEKKLIKEALFSYRFSRDVQLTFCKNATMASLRTELERKPDILHYIGHSEFKLDKKRACLLLESDDRTSEEVDADDFGALLAEFPVKLVLLNSCEGAATSKNDAFAGIAQTLVKAGISTVVAMQHPIPDKTALWFSKIFYSTLITKYSVDGAVAEARRYIMTKTSLRRQDWATPVLFMRTKDGEVFKRDL
jgi:CHASE2 domain-containing sensor protein